MFIVTAATLELYVLPFLGAALPVDNLTFMRMIRLFKLAKVLRAVRAVSIFQPLRLLMVSILSSGFTLAWSIVFLTAIQFVCAIFMTQMLQAFLLDADND